jgi:hypothetical protein
MMTYGELPLAGTMLKPPGMVLEDLPALYAAKVYIESSKMWVKVLLEKSEVEK